jgi:spore germination protein GerM
MNKKALFLIVVAVALGWLVWQSGIFNAVIFSGEKVEAEIYFGNSALDPETDCQTVFPVKRTVSVEAPARPSLEELFMGPSESEKEAGYFTSIPEGVKINSLKIENNVAYVDLSEELEKGVGGSCRVAAIRFQITKTLKQSPSISSVVISINSRVEDILQP